MLYSPSSHASIFSPMLLHFLSHAPPFSLPCSSIFSSKESSFSSMSHFSFLYDNSARYRKMHLKVKKVAKKIACYEISVYLCGVLR